jgi:ketosteroid isomerase-like protein
MLACMTAETAVTGQTARQRAAAAWAAFATMDPAQVSAVLTPDAEWLAPPANATAMAIDGTWHLIGRDRIVRFLCQEYQAVFVSDRTFDVVAMFGEGDLAVTEVRLGATLASGHRYDNDYCFVFEFDGDRIRRVREYMDTQRGAVLFAGRTLPGED